MGKRIAEPAVNPSESNAQRAVRIRREYDAIPNSDQDRKTQAAADWLAAEGSLNADDYIEYQAIYRGRVSETTNTEKTE